MYMFIALIRVFIYQDTVKIFDLFVILQANFYNRIFLKT